jgi:uncharacterized protein involved in outer membrane biogenesis
MTRIIKYISVVILAIVTMLVGFFFTFDINHYKDDIVHAVESQTGRKVSIAGKIHLGLSLLPTVVIEKVSLGNASWGTRPAMLKVRRLEAQIALMPLLHRYIRLTRFVLVRPELYLETDRRGRGNWEIAAGGKKQKAETETSSPPSLRIHHILIEEATVIYRDGRSHRQRSMFIPRLSLNAGGGSMRLALQADYDKKPIRVDGSIASLDTLLSNRPYKVDLKGRLGKFSLTLKGDVQQPLEARGLKLDLKLIANSLKGLTRVGRVSVTASLADEKPGVYAIKSIKARLGGSEIRGTAMLDLNGARPAVDGSLDTGRLDLSPFLKSRSRRTRLFSRTPLPVVQMQKLDADVDITAAKVVSPELILHGMKMRLRLHRGRLRLSPLSAKVADGDLSGEVDVISRGTSMVDVYALLRVKGLKPGLLPKLKGKFRDGRTDITLHAAGRGDSIAAVMAGLNGNLLARMGKGKVQTSSLEKAGGDLLMRTLSLLSPENNKDAMSNVRCGVAAFHVRQGLARSDKGIAMETNGVNAVGGGVVNLATEKLDLGLRPYARKGLGASVGRMAEVVRLGGTLAHPEPKADTLAAVKTAATVGAAFVTGGISLLAGGLYNMATVDEHPCTTALAFANKDRPAATTAAPK